MIVNAAITGLIVFRILKVYREIGRTCEDRTLGFGGAETRIRSIIFIIIESGIAMFTIQLIEVLVFILPTDSGELTLGIWQMFMVIIQLVISFHSTKIIFRD